MHLDERKRTSGRKVGVKSSKMVGVGGEMSLRQEN